MKHSIRKQFAGIFIALMAGTILVCWFLNNTFLEQYYMYNKAKTLDKAFQKINEAGNSQNINTSDFQESMNEVCLQNNITALVIDFNSVPVYVSNDIRKVQLAEALFKYILYYSQEGFLTEPGEYRILYSTARDSDWLDMVGLLENAYPFILRIPMESIRESVKTANQFLAYVGTVMVLVSGIIIWLITRKITDPILELTSISERMNNLDFDAKYHGRSKNEIALLGDNINRLSNTLEKTISELKTANNELKKDIEKKEQIDEMRKEFLSNVSHELKTPIALIQGYAEGLAEGINEDPESRDFYCEVIMDEASKMNTMVKKLLTLNQLEFGNKVISMERFDVVSLISNYIQSAQILTKQNGIEVRMEKYDPVYVWADEFKTEEVFMNYFTNAVNHCEGKKIIDVKLELLENNKVRVGVFNTGVPIPDDSLGHLWEKFDKVDKARTREYGGSGVGLSIVKAIMDSMNQHYGVQNYTNGVQFWFELETVKEDSREGWNAGRDME